MSAILATIMLLQVGPNPAYGSLQDFSAEVQDRPARNQEQQTPLPVTGDQPQSAWLMQCLDMVENDPARAHVQAQLRRDEKSGEERILARHCLGLAATKLERWDEARAEFLFARDEAPANDHRFRARLGAMAANAAIGGADIAAALAIWDNARADARKAQANDLEGFIAIDQARALVSQGKTQEAAAHLAEARRLRPTDSEAFLLSATLMRRLEQLEEAQRHIESAAALAPNNPAIGLEAGVIAVLDGRDEAARNSWQSVINSQPDSPSAASARSYLAQLGPVANSEGEQTQ